MRQRSGRIFASVLFTDVVGSPSAAAALGERRWRALLGDHHTRVRQAILILYAAFRSCHREWLRSSSPQNDGPRRK